MRNFIMAVALGASAVSVMVAHHHDARLSDKLRQKEAQVSFLQVELRQTKQDLAAAKSKLRVPGPLQAACPGDRLYRPTRVGVSQWDAHGASLRRTGTYPAGRPHDIRGSIQSGPGSPARSYERPYLC